MDVGWWTGEGGGRWVQGGREGRVEVGGCRTVDRGGRREVDVGWLRGEGGGRWM